MAKIKNERKKSERELRVLPGMPDEDFYRHSQGPRRIIYQDTREPFVFGDWDSYNPPLVKIVATTERFRKRMMKIPSLNGGVIAKAVKDKKSDQPCLVLRNGVKIMLGQLPFLHTQLIAI